MQKKRLLFDQKSLEITLKRLCQEITENLSDEVPTVLIGLQPRVIFLADRLAKLLNKKFGINLQVGHLDATFHRDDYNRDGNILNPKTTSINFLVEDKNVILIDDVIASGRMVRSGIDALQDFGRPAQVELLCLINRKYQRDLPIQPDYVGKEVNTLNTQKVLVEWKDETREDAIWIIDRAK